jgi:hypothetical protein
MLPALISAASLGVISVSSVALYSKTSQVQSEFDTKLNNIVDQINTAQSFEYDVDKKQQQTISGIINNASDIRNQYSSKHDLEQQLSTQQLTTQQLNANGVVSINGSMQFTSQEFSKNPSYVMQRNGNRLAINAPNEIGSGVDITSSGGISRLSVDTQNGRVNIPNSLKTSEVYFNDNLLLKSDKDNLKLVNNQSHPTAFYSDKFAINNKTQITDSELKLNNYTLNTNNKFNINNANNQNILNLDSNGNLNLPMGGFSSTKPISANNGIVINTGVDSGAGRGLNLWNQSDPRFGMWASTPGAGKGLNGLNAAGDDLTGISVRFATDSNANNGFMFQNTAGKPLTSIRGSDGRLNAYGDVNALGNVNVSGTLNSAKYGPITSSSLSTDKLVLNNKWKTSNLNNDSWLRFFDQNGTDLYGGIMTDNSYTRNTATINNANISNATTNQLTNIGIGKSNFITVQATNKVDNIRVGYDGVNRGIWSDGKSNMSIYNNGNVNMTMSNDGSVIIPGTLNAGVVMTQTLGAPANNFISTDLVNGTNWFTIQRSDGNIKLGTNGSNVRGIINEGDKDFSIYSGTNPRLTISKNGNITMNSNLTVSGALTAGGLPVANQDWVNKSSKPQWTNIQGMPANLTTPQWSSIQGVPANVTTPQWSSIQGVPANLATQPWVNATSMPQWTNIQGKPANLAAPQWSNIQGVPANLSTPQWSNIQGVPANLATPSWSNIQGVPANLATQPWVNTISMPQWTNIQGKPANLATPQWSNIQGTPNLLRGDVAVWQQSTDLKNRILFTANDKTVFGSQNGYQFNNKMNNSVAYLDDGGNFNNSGKISSASNLCINNACLSQTDIAGFSNLAQQIQQQQTNIATLTQQIQKIQNMPILAPINCAVSAWSACDKSCGGGTQTRTVTTQATNGGTACPALTQVCNQQACPVDCVVSGWSACDKPCGGGTQTRSIVTQSANGGAACPALSQVCNQQACPVDCTVSGWSTCSKPCGGGSQTRTVTTAAANGGVACPALSQVCNSQACPVDCVVSGWSGCDKACGGGTQTRTVTTAAANGGVACPALSQVCNQQACPVDCAVSGWSACSKSCGGGTQTRSVTTAAANGGAACPALSQVCNQQACSSGSDLTGIDGQWIAPCGWNIKISGTTGGKNGQALYVPNGVSYACNYSGNNIWQMPSLLGGAWIRDNTGRLVCIDYANSAYKFTPVNIDGAWFCSASGWNMVVSGTAGPNNGQTIWYGQSTSPVVYNGNWYMDSIFGGGQPWTRDSLGRLATNANYSAYKFNFVSIDGLWKGTSTGWPMAITGTSGGKSGIANFNNGGYQYPVNYLGNYTWEMPNIFGAGYKFTFDTNTNNLVCTNYSYYSFSPAF